MVMQTKTIKARYRNGILEPLEKIDMPEGSEIDLSIEVIPISAQSELSKEEKKKLIRKLCGSAKGLWGKTAEEIDAYIKSERESWE